MPKMPLVSSTRESLESSMKYTSTLQQNKNFNAAAAGLCKFIDLQVQGQSYAPLPRLEASPKLVMGKAKAF